MSEKVIPTVIPKKAKRRVISSDNVVLVPYLDEHVPRYNKWMQDPSILSLTGSEPLSLEEEYDMCRQWKEDNEKITYILLSPSVDEGADAQSANAEAADAKSPTTTDGSSKTRQWVVDRLDRLVGDANLFLSVCEELGDNGELVSSVFEAELEVMVAEPSARRGGIATQACRILIGEAFGLGVERVFVKIKDGNDGSRKLFEKLGFALVRYVECFGETEMELKAPLPTDPGVVFSDYIEPHT